jgi:hypothetical protein
MLPGHPYISIHGAASSSLEKRVIKCTENRCSSSRISALKCGNRVDLLLMLKPTVCYSSSATRFDGTRRHTVENYHVLSARNSLHYIGLASGVDSDRLAVLESMLFTSNYLHLTRTNQIRSTTGASLWKAIHRWFHTVYPHVDFRMHFDQS